MATTATTHAMPKGPKHTTGKTAQQGVALIMVLLFLVAITGLTVWAARQSMLGEGMSRNQQDLEIARQAAESALRDGERDLGGVISLPGPAPCNPDPKKPRKILPANFTANCTTGLCYRADESYFTNVWSSATSAAGAEPWWPTGKGGQWNAPVDAITNCLGFTGGVPVGTFTGAPAILGVSRQPQYLIEYFKRAVPGRQEMPVYRITARGFGYSTRTQVVVQSIFLPE